MANTLRTFTLSDNPVVIEQVLTAVSELNICESAIQDAETQMNHLVFDLYGLTPAEKALIASG